MISSWIDRTMLGQLKVIRSGKLIEVFHYDLPEKREKTISCYEKKRGQRKIFDENYLKKQKNKKYMELMRLFYANPQLDKFLTLTPKENIKSLSQMYVHYHRFQIKMRRLFPDMSYICVPEFQARGAVHYHIALNIPYTPVMKLYMMWRLGGVHIEKRKKGDLATYLSSYLTEEMFAGDMYGKKKYFCSRNIKRPEVAYGDQALTFIDALTSSGVLDLKSQKVIENSFIGKISYFVYQIKEWFYNRIYKRIDFQVILEVLNSSFTQGVNENAVSFLPP